MADFGAGGGEGVGREVASEGNGGEYGGAFAENGSGLEDGVAAGFGVVTHERTEFAEISFNSPGGGLHSDGFLVEAEIGADCARAEVGAVAEHRVADIIIMRGLHAIEEQAIFIFATIAEHAFFTSDDIAADEHTGAEVGMRANPRRALDDAVGREFDRGVQVNEALDAQPGRNIDP